MFSTTPVRFLTEKAAVEKEGEKLGPLKTLNWQGLWPFHAYHNIISTMPNQLMHQRILE